MDQWKVHVGLRRSMLTATILVAPDGFCGLLRVLCGLLAGSMLKSVLAQRLHLGMRLGRTCWLLLRRNSKPEAP
jgi:hypothetical protein